MKRFAWLLVAVFALAMVQARPVDTGVVQQETCGCCEPGASACGMPDCGPAPASPASCLAVAPGVAVARTEAESVLPKSRCLRDRFVAEYSPRQAAPAALVPRSVAPPASVPAFKAHCSYLI
jgi:hypothetical protein